LRFGIITSRLIVVFVQTQLLVDFS
jgi:hypothetical protein